MNTPNIARNASAQWLYIGTAIVGMMLAAVVAFGLMSRTVPNVALGTPAVTSSAARPFSERYAAFKQQQADQVADSAIVVAVNPNAPISGTGSAYDGRSYGAGAPLALPVNPNVPISGTGSAYNPR